MRVIPHTNSSPQWAGWMPSFIYVLSFSLLSAAALGTGPRSRFLIPIFWMMVASAIEAGQYFHPSVRSIVPVSWDTSIPVRYLENYFLHGIFDPLDLAAGFVGMLVAVLVFAFPRGYTFVPHTNPQSPINLLFLPIPWNLDMAVKDGVLYADSYVDLVAIDISNVNAIHEINRLQTAFSYDPYQNIQDPSVNFCDSVDATRGVVVNYTPR